MASPSSPAAPPWVILSCIASVQNDDVKDPLDLSLELVDPPYISQLTVPTSAHPNTTRNGADMYPYVITANDSGLVLLHMSEVPFGFNMGTNPPGVLVVARGFLPADGHGARTGTAERAPRRDEHLQHRVSTVRSVGLLPVHGTGGAEYVVAELLVSDLSCLLTFRSGSDFWDEQVLTTPLVWGNWTPHDVIAHDGKLWWADLTQGLLVCNLLDLTPELHYVELPEIFAVKGAKPGNEIKWYRFVGVSDGLLRFVDVSQKRGEPREKTPVVVWTLVCDPFAKDGLSGKRRWELHTTTTLGMIWANNSYKASRMPEEVPVLAFLHPDKPDVVYFLLMEYLFAVDMSNCKVVEFVRGLRRPLVDCWRNCIPWVLPPSRPNDVDSHDKKDGVAPAG